MQLATEECFAHGDRELVGGAIVASRDAALTRELQTFESVIEDEVHDTGHGIRAVAGGGAAGHDINGLDQIVRER